MPVELSLRPWIFLWTITLFSVTISATSPDELPTWWHEGPLWDRTPSPIAGDPDSLLDYHDLSWTASHFDQHSELPPHADSLPHWHPQARPFQVTPASWETTSTSFDDVPSMANQQVGALKRKHGDYEQLFNVEPFAPASSLTHLSRSQDPFLNDLYGKSSMPTSEAAHYHPEAQTIAQPGTPIPGSHIAGPGILNQGDHQVGAEQPHAESNPTSQPGSPIPESLVVSRGGLDRGDYRQAAVDAHLPESDPGSKQASSLVSDDTLRPKKIRKITIREPLRRLFKPEGPLPTNLSRSTQLLDHVLRQHCAEFGNHWKSEDFKLLSHQVTPPPLHPDLALVLFLVSDDEHGDKGVLRVMDSSHKIIRHYQYIAPLYRTLIAWMWDRYTSVLNNLNIHKSDHNPHLKKMLKWLDQEIFAPKNSLPLVGIVHPPWPVVRDDNLRSIMGETQSELLDYFSESENSRIASDLASNLIRKYCDNLGIDPQVAINAPEPNIKREPIQLPMDPSFREKFEFLVGLSRPGLTKGEGPNKMWAKHPSRDLVKSVYDYFKVLVRKKIGTFHPTLLRKPHSELPMVLLYSEDLPGAGYLRILRILNNETVASKYYFQYFRHLTKHIDFIHRRLINHLKLSEEEHQARMKKMLHWLIDQTVQPTNGIPIFGEIHDPNIVKLWLEDKLEYKSHFSPVQLSMIRYYSILPNHLEHQETLDTVAYVLVCWYQSHSPEGSISLSL
ncbi:hypothetical protein MJO28_001166 [Puccinia striiformis f. sp. tritici]|uniref:Uncharacterized protein n=1 Tax=Puccinia striiformis f. sp. tritici TaxID=168172 RepID=A0ACC0F095_9BASI|nr:hypothetical protein MJO28_001166 [Puccinia striiformis f. sp. tritici]